MTEKQTVDLAAWLTHIWDEEERGFDLACEAEAERCRNDGIPNMTAAEVKAYWQTLPDWGGWKLTLARIAADRKILELHKATDWYAPDELCCEICHEDRSHGPDAWQAPGERPCATLKALASPYKGREGWQEAWGHE